MTVNSIIIPAKAGIQSVIPVKTGIQVLVSLALALGLSGVQVGFGQVEVEWERTYEVNGTCYGLVVVPERGFYLFGGNNDDHGNGFVLATNQDGNELWQNSFGTHDVDLFSSAVADHNGDINFAGIAVVGGAYTYWLLKTNADGDSLWSRNFYMGNGPCLSIVQADNGDYAMGGMSHTQAGMDCSLLSVDDNGDSLWSQYYGGNGEQSSYSMAKTSNGFVLAGKTIFGEANSEFLVVNINSDGELLWSQSYGAGNRTDECLSIITTSDGGFAMAGFTNSIGAGDLDYYVIRTDENGELLWSRSFGGVGEERCRKILQTFDGGFILAGESSSFGEDDIDFWLLRIDSNGDSLWSTTFSYDGNERCGGLSSMNDSSYLLSGTGASSYNLIKTTPDPVIAHQISLRAGWNMISSICPPANAAMPAVWEEIVSRGNLIIAKNQSGQFYMPGMFNGMAPWDVRQGYMAKLAEVDTLVIVNVPVDVQTPIPLRQGWNIIAYFPEEELDVRDAFVSIQDDLIMVKDINGRFYRAQIGFSNMFPLRRGQGYQVAVGRAVELVYPDGGERFASRGQTAAADRLTADLIAANRGGSAAEELSHFQPVECTGGNMSVLVGITPPYPPLQAEGERNAKYFPQAEGEIEIGVFTENGLCVGAFLFQNPKSKIQNQIGLPIWQDDPSTPEIDGAVEGEALSFRMWDGKAEVNAEFRMQNAELSTGRDLQFVTDGFAEVTLDVGAIRETPLPMVVALHDAFPNPFNASTLIRFDLPQASSVSLSVTDVTGREIIKLVEGNYAAGRHSFVWNALNQPGGVYLIKLETPLGVRTQKALLVK